MILSRYIRLVFVLVFFLTTQSFAAKKKAAPNEKRASPYMLSYNEFKSLNKDQQNKYMDKLLVTWVAYEKSTGNGLIGEFKSPQISIGLSSANASGKVTEMWCTNSVSSQCYIAGNLSCKGQYPNDSDKNCKIPTQAQCDDRRPGVKCTAPFAKQANGSAFCAEPVNGSYLNVSQTCLALTRDAVRTGSASYDPEQMRAVLDENSAQRKAVDQFCNTHPAPPSWPTTCGALTEARQLYSTWKPSPADQIPQVGDVSQIPAEQAPPKQDQSNQTRPTPTTPAQQTPVRPTGNGAKWCAEDNNFQFAPAKLDAQRALKGDELRDNLKVQGSERVIVENTSCMLCGLKIACGDTSANIGLKSDPSYNFSEACKGANKQIEKRIQAHQLICGSDNSTMAFTNKWIELNKKFGYLQMKERAGDKTLIRLINEYYYEGNKIGVFCASGNETVNPKTSAYNWSRDWDKNNLSPVVMIQDEYNFKKTQGLNGKGNAAEAAAREEYQRAIAGSLGMTEFRSQTHMADAAQGKDMASPFLKFVCDAKDHKNTFGTNGQATQNAPATQPEN